MLHIQVGYIHEQETRIAKHLIDKGRRGRIYHARSTGFRRRGRPFVEGYGSSNIVRKDYLGRWGSV